MLTVAETLSGLRTVRAVLAPDLTDEELRLFAMVANRSGLDVFAKQLYAVKRKGRVTFQTGIDGYRSIAARTGQYDGQDEPEYGPVCECGDNRPAGHPESVTVRVYRKDMSRAIAASAAWHEYKPEQGPSGMQDSMWVKMPRVMLAKVAEALALRKAFPYDPERRQGIGADLYTADEMAQAGAPQNVAPASPPPSARDRVMARAAAIRETPPAVEATEEPADQVPEPVEGEIEGVAPEGVSAEAFWALASQHGVKPQQLASALDARGVPATPQNASAVVNGLDDVLRLELASALGLFGAAS
jgi:phage recombination protein Bet